MQRPALLPCLFMAACGVPLFAQQGPPPQPSATSGTGAAVHELLPGIGKIGAQVALFAGPSWNPYEIGTGFELGGYINLPLRRLPGGKLSYEIFAGVSVATSDPFSVTNPLAYVANLASGATPANALRGPPFAPFPVSRDVKTKLHLVHLSPFALKYTITRWDDARVRLSLGAGADVLVVLTRQDPTGDQSQQFAGTSPFDDPLIAGEFAQAPELTARGYPTGQGNAAIGGHAAAGLEFRLSKGVSLNLEYRFTLAEGGSKSRLQSATGALGFHF